MSPETRCRRRDSGGRCRSVDRRCREDLRSGAQTNGHNLQGSVPYRGSGRPSRTAREPRSRATRASESRPPGLPASPGRCPDSACSRNRERRSCPDSPMPAPAYRRRHASARNRGPAAPRLCRSRASSRRFCRRPRAGREDRAPRNAGRSCSPNSTGWTLPPCNAPVCSCDQSPRKVVPTRFIRPE